MAAYLRPAVMCLILFTLITGVVYPLVVTGIAQVIFPFQANGSLVVKDGKVVGSALIGQPFDEPKYFCGRPSVTSPFGYNAAASSGSNLSPTNPDLVKAVQGRVEALRAADPGNTAPVPVDLVTASGSGLDPHISPAAALYQVSRVARERKLAPDAVRALVDRNTEGRFWGLLGEPRVNVLALNLALDGSSPALTPRRGALLGGLVTILLLAPGVARAQQSVADLLGRPATPKGQAKSYPEELMLYSYIENSFAWNLRTVGRGDVNELRFYDHDNGYTFNAAEFSLTKDPSARYRLG